MEYMIEFRKKNVGRLGIYFTEITAGIYEKIFEKIPNKR